MEEDQNCGDSPCELAESPVSSCCSTRQGCTPAPVPQQAYEAARRHPGIRERYCEKREPICPGFAQETSAGRNHAARDNRALEFPDFAAAQFQKAERSNRRLQTARLGITHGLSPAMLLEGNHLVAHGGSIAQS